MGKIGSLVLGLVLVSVVAGCGAASLYRAPDALRANRQIVSSVQVLQQQKMNDTVITSSYAGCSAVRISEDIWVTSAAVFQNRLKGLTSQPTVSPASINLPGQVIEAVGLSSNGSFAYLRARSSGQPVRTSEYSPGQNYRLGVEFEAARFKSGLMIPHRVWERVTVQSFASQLMAEVNDSTEETEMQEMVDEQGDHITVHYTRDSTRLQCAFAVMNINGELVGIESDVDPETNTSTLVPVADLQQEAEQLLR